MSYSFFGTCYEDSEILIECLISMANQSITPNEVIIIDASKRPINFNLFENIFDSKETSIIYKNIQLPRVKALNYAISQANSDYLLRFDTRTRFAKNYAEEALKLFNKKNNPENLFGAVGGRQASYPANESMNAKIASSIMNRSYIFGNPLYRRINYSGNVNSIYLGCFPKKILYETPFREEVSLISEDTQLCQDIIAKGYLVYISKDLKLKYKCRNNIFSIFKLFRTYGRCRARTIISMKKIHDKKKYLLILFISLFIPILSFSIFKEEILFSIFFILLVPLTYNIIHEIKVYGYKKIIYMPFIGLIAQLNWAFGLIEGIILFKFLKNKKTNFLK